MAAWFHASSLPLLEESTRVLLHAEKTKQTQITTNTTICSRLELKVPERYELKRV